MVQVHATWADKQWSRACNYVIVENLSVEIVTFHPFPLLVLRGLRGLRFTHLVVQPCVNPSVQSGLESALSSSASRVHAFYVIPQPRHPPLLPVGGRGGRAIPPPSPIGTNGPTYGLP